MSKSRIQIFEEQVKELGGNGSIALEEEIRGYIIEQDGVLGSLSGVQKERVMAAIKRAEGTLAVLESRLSPGVREAAMEYRKRLP